MHRSTAAAAAALGILALTAAPAAARPAPLPAEMVRIMAKPRYAHANWGLFVKDVRTGRTYYSLHPNQLNFSASTRKLFSVGVAMDSLGARHRETTTVQRSGDNLVLRAAGDLTFGGRRIDDDTVAITSFDHNEAKALGTSILTPQDPLYALNRLAQQVRAAGITSVPGDIVVDDRLFEPYRVPNGNLLISPMMVNENLVDVTADPTAPGAPAAVAYRPHTSAFGVDGTITTTAAGTPAKVQLSDNWRISCIGQPGCLGTVSGSLPVGYRAPLSHEPSFVGTFRVEEPAAFARTAFIDALERAGVAVAAAPVAANPRDLLPASRTYPAGAQVAAYRSAPYAQIAKLILKVSLNQGANLSLSLFGLQHGQRTIQGALRAERHTLVRRFGIPPTGFSFPTNGSGTPDSRATPRALVTMLRAMARSRNAAPYAAGFPILGVDGSLAHYGEDLPARGHVLGKTGTTAGPTPDGEGIEIKAQNLAGYITTKSGRRLAYALMINDIGEVEDIEAGVGETVRDQAAIANALYEAL